MKRVYFLRPVGQLGPIKIGCSKLPELRLETLTVWSPMRLELICSVPGTHKDERTLHGMFHKHHVHGEWFGASKELLALIDHCQATGELPALPEVVKFPRVRHVGRKGRAAGKKEPGELSAEKMALARELRCQHESGLSAQDIAAEHGLSYHTVLRYIRAAGGSLQRGRPKTEKGVLDTERADDMRSRYLAGETLQQIGNSYGLTRERVRQILRKTGVASLGFRDEHKTPPSPPSAAQQEAAKLYQEGVRPREIAKRTGIPVSNLAHTLRRCGVGARSKGYWLRRPDDAYLTEQVCAHYSAGLSAPEIVARLPQLKFRETVYRYLKKGGVKPRTSKGRFRNHGAAAA